MSINCPIYQIPTALLLSYANPLTNPPWITRKRIAPINPSEVILALNTGQLAAHTISDREYWNTPPSRDYHIQRIAYLCANPATDPIDIEVGVPGHTAVSDWLVTNGNHRLAAASVMGWEMIPAYIGGCLRKASEMFSINVEQSASH